MEGMATTRIYVAKHLDPSGYGVNGDFSTGIAGICQSIFVLQEALKTTS